MRYNYKDNTSMERGKRWEADNLTCLSSDEGHLWRGAGKAPEKGMWRAKV